jgi:hypothetical protein
MTLSLGVMVWFAMEKRKRANYERYVPARDEQLPFQ